ncbi:MAG: MATE family efflux transporter [Spirochaetaceae bacterium]|jgi:putative MATE family efflux protein|nr:MATE family efflux transporter [Spirochaetaceae bacterium]
MSDTHIANDTHIENESTARMGKWPVGKLLLEFAVPAIIGMLVSALYNVVDRIYIGQGVNHLGIAGIGLVMPIMMIIQALSMLIGIGSNSLFAIRMGEGRSHEVERIMGHAFALLFLIPLTGIIGSFIFFEPLLLNVLKASPDVYPYASGYLRIILYGSIFAAMSPGLTHFIRSDGHPKTSMLVQIVGALTNIILDPIFIFVFKLGVQGAAWATIISQFISLVFVLGYFNSKWTRLRFRFENMKLSLKLSGQIMAIGFAPFIMQIAMSLVGILQNSQILRYGGDNALTAMTITFSISSMIMMPLMGIGQGSQPIMGYNYGAKKFDRVKRCFKIALISNLSLLFLGMILSETVPGLLFRLFSSDEGPLQDLAVRTIRICNSMFPLVAFQMMGGQFFQSIGKPLQGTILSLSRQILFFIPCIYLLPLLWGRLGFTPVEGVFWTFPISDALSAVLSFSFVSWEFRKWKKINHE